MWLSSRWNILCHNKNDTTRSVDEIPSFFYWPKPQSVFRLMLYLHNENMWNHLGPLQIHGTISMQLHLCQHCITKHWAEFSVYPLLKSASRSNISCKREDTQPCYMYFGNSLFTFRQKLGNNPRIKVLSSCILLSLLCIRHLSTHFQNFHTISASSQTY